MEQRLFGGWSWGRAGRDALIGLIATSFYFLIGKVVNIAPTDLLFLMGGGAIFFGLAFLADRLWAIHRFRCAVLTFSQRPLAYVIYSLVASGIVALVFLWPLPQALDIVPVRDVVSSLSAITQAAILAAVFVVVFVICFLLDRVRLTGAQCHTVLHRIIRQWDTGRYIFGHGATRREIRQESRFLDYLARRSKGRIKRHWGGYQFANDDGASVALALKGMCAGMFSEDPQAAVACANDHWRKGHWYRNRWRPVGDEAHAAPEGEFAKPLFGNHLDMLFNGGDGFRARMPEGPRFQFMVIKGQPGAGKSTQALQLCVTLAQRGHYCLYYSLEEERESLIQAAHNFGWADPTGEYAGVRHLDLHLLRRRHRRRWSKARASSAQANAAGVWVSSLGDRAMPVALRKKQLHKEWQDVEQVPRCVVIDSLEGFANVGLDRETPEGVPRAELLALKDFFRDRCEMLVILVEDDGSGQPGYVDFVADTVIQLGRDQGNGYLLLVAEILKARNQNHALGSHQMKIRSQDDINRATGPVRASLRDLHPGLILYPSLHYRLFQAQHRHATADYVLSSGLRGLDQMLPGVGNKEGIRRQSALALLGPSGTGKSVLALNFLVEGVRENTPTLLLLLHNDPATITSRSIPQEPHRMRFSWRSEVDANTGNTVLYHHFEWTLDGIARWCAEREPFFAALTRLNGPDAPDTAEAFAIVRENFSRLLRLPYIFKLAPLDRPITAADLPELRSWQTSPTHSKRQAFDQAIAVEELLHTLATYQPPLDAAGRPRWSADARYALRQAFDAAWSHFVGRVGIDALVPGVDAQGAPKRIILENAQDGLGVDAPPPYLRWDSRYWEPEKRERIRERFPTMSYTGDLAGTMCDTRLLKIRDFRPGNITPEDFVDRLLRDIGEPTEESQYERVVFDDVTQLSQRFPLLANSPLFLPTVIDMFKATGITSLFLADAESGTALETNDRVPQDWGIAIMADQVVRTSHQQVTPDGDLLPPRRYNKREIIAQVDALPGDERHAPHILRVRREPSRFTPDEVESLVSLDELPKAPSGNLSAPPIA